MCSPTKTAVRDLERHVSASVDELQGEVELLALQQGDDLLQVVLLLRRDAQFVALHLCPDALRSLVPDDLGDLPGVVLRDALLEADVSRYSLPESLGSSGSRALSDTPRLTSLSLNTSRTALARSSLFALISTACSPDQAMDAPTPRKSKRVPISLAAWFSALSTSWRLILDTMSKRILDATAPRLDVAGPVGTPDAP